MEKIKLYQLLSAFTEEDVKAARKFLTSPFHNTDPLVCGYFDHLRKFHPKMEGEQLRSEAVFKHLFPKQKLFDEKKLRNLRHKLTRLLESFLAHERLQGEQAVQQRLLIGALSKRNAYPLFKKEIETQANLLEKAANRGVDYHREMAWLQHELYFHPETERLEAYHPAIFSATKNFEMHHCIAMLCYTAEMNARSRLLPENWQPCTAMDTLEKAAAHFAPDSLLIEFLSKLLGPEKNQLEVLKITLDGCEHQLGKYELGIALKMLINIAIVRSNQLDDLPSHQLLFELYRKGFDSGLYSERDARNVSRFINIAATATLAREFNWAKNFIDQHKAYLEANDRDDTEHLCMAHWYYHRGRQNKNAVDFKAALSHLAQVRHTNDLIEIRIRPLQLRILFENLPNDPNSFSTIKDYTRNFQGFLARSSALSAQKVGAYLNFIKYFKVLVQLRKKSPPDTLAVSSFLAQLAQENSIVIKNWLLEMGEDMKW